MSNAILSISLTDESKRAIALRSDSLRKLPGAISDGLTRIAEEAAAHVQEAYFTGYRANVSHASKLSMVFNRSGALRQAVRPGSIDRFTKFVGTSAGTTSAYARTILSDETTAITPKRGKYLWVPIADNLNPSGQARYTPREAMGVRTATGKRALRIFRSKAGNLVAFLPGKEIVDTAGKRLGLVRTRMVGGAGRYTRGEKKGMRKGQLLFVLKRFVVVEGSGALEKGVMDMGERGATILNMKIAEVLN